ncbi:MAG: TIGR01777 family oxidoreductase [Nitrospirota bacterium]
MKIVITGGTGFIGRALCRALAAEGHDVVVLSRRAGEGELGLDPSVRVVEWDGVTAGPWERELEAADAVINLAGASIAEARWTAERKRMIYESRIAPTRLLAQALGRASARPRMFLSASGVGYYGPRDDRPLQEHDPPGTGFLAELCVAWEREAMSAQQAGARVVCLRFGMVLEKDGGALPKMLPPFRAFIGGPIGPGTQWVSWIHRQDLIGIMEWVLAAPAVSSPVNAVAPGAVTMREFCATLGRVLRRPSWLPVPERVLRLALGELGTVLTTGQRVLPEVAQQGGYRFRYPSLEPALQAILGPAVSARPAA